MTISRWFISLVGVGLMMAAVTTDADAQQPGEVGPSVAKTFRLNGPLFADSRDAGGDKAERYRFTSLELAASDQEDRDEVEENGAIRWDVDDFFNVRQANSDVEPGEWELEFGTRWFTDSTGGDDDSFFVGELAYGITDDAFVELRLLPINIGDGGDQGNGDVELEIFNRFVHETDVLPSIGLSLEGRFPSGQGSSGVDGEFGVHLTKTIVPKARGHVEGFVETANGGRTEEEEDEGRHFQWGVGVGFDYEFSEKLLGLLNYVHRSSEEYGARNEQLLELGVNYKITPAQGIKVATDIGLTGVGEEPNFGVKIQYEIELH